MDRRRDRRDALTALSPDLAPPAIPDHADASRVGQTTGHLAAKSRVHKGHPHAPVASQPARSVVPRSLNLTTRPVASTVGQPFINEVVASFVRPDADRDEVEFTATISWGDGYLTPTSVVAVGDGVYHVLGTHAYLELGLHAFTVRVSDGCGARECQSGTAAIGAHAAGQLGGPHAAVPLVPGESIAMGRRGDVAYWRGPDGTDLIHAFDGGPTSLTLGHWLAATLPNVFGAEAGSHDLARRTNAQVADFLKRLARSHRIQGRTQAQTLATALNVYATTRSLGGEFGRRHRFRVTSAGFGAAAFTVGRKGPALGFSRGSARTVAQFLAAANAHARDGILSPGLPQNPRVAELFAEINAGIVESTPLGNTMRPQRLPAI